MCHRLYVIFEPKQGPIFVSHTLHDCSVMHSLHLKSEACKSGYLEAYICCFKGRVLKKVGGSASLFSGEKTITRWRKNHGAVSGQIGLGLNGYLRAG